jgi:cytochrome d ubiquinol oxidase subunit I
MVAGGLVAAIAGWHLARLHGHDAADTSGHGDARTWRWAARFGAWVLLAASVVVMASGDFQGKVMTEVQPMKMAAAEAHYNTADGSNFSVLSIGNLEGTEAEHLIQVPGLLGYLASGRWGAPVKGINDLKAEYASTGFVRNDGSQTDLQKTYAPELTKQDVALVPNVPVAYWTFRLMMGLGFAGIAIAAWILWATRRGRTPRPSRPWMLAMGLLPFLPLLANSFGWIFTEMGRQPWLVAGVMPTLSGVSPGVSTGMVLFSMIAYTVVYGGLAVIEMGLFMKYLKAGLPDVAPVEVIEDEDAPLSFAY